MSDYLWFEGMPFPGLGYTKELLEEICDKFVVRDEDTVILTYPKSVAYGSWFKHTCAWMSMRKMDNFMVLSYEDMKKDTRKIIEKICDFLGKKLEPDELDMVLKYSSFQAMKENKMSNFSLITEDEVTNRLVLLRNSEEIF
ncbi:Bile salt sulfotransferase 1 [Microtus ochrogaster]|uniref:Sulfotransferase n=1 Tax=Microtus ochrogaster TaxID=79684 RepID=A0A8J6KKR0_MICOH|nr:Bile salt sulfotransferase 1 [Microtus ochrogaster]